MKQAEFAAKLPATLSLLLQRDGSCLNVTMNTPEVRNAMSAQMWQEMAAVFAAIRDDRSIRIVVLSGAGGHFSSGGNTKERSAIGDDDRVATAKRNRTGGLVLAQIDQAPQVVIALVQGSALGGGMGLACVADIVIADDTSAFRLPEASIGVIPAQIAPYLIRRIGVSHARRLALTAATVRGDEALKIGLIHHLCPGPEELKQKLSELRSEVERCGPHAVAATKALLREAESAGADYVDRAAERFAAVYCGAEGQEGATALRERRPPYWQSPTKR